MLAFLSFVLVLTLACAQEPAILFEGRIPVGLTGKNIDDGNTNYQAIGDRPENQKWNEIITTVYSYYKAIGVRPENQKLNEIFSTEYYTKSLFDGDDYQSFEMSFRDETVFKKNPGFIRAQLTNDPVKTKDITSGVTAYHFSIKKVANAELDLTHQYELLFLENDVDHRHIFELRYGTNYTGEYPVNVDDNAGSLRIQSSSIDGMDKMRPLFEVNFCPDVFHNFAVAIDWYQSTISVYYSRGEDELELVVEPTANSLKAPASLHVGLLKLPVGPSYDTALAGYQEKDINEALVYGGVFVEDSSKGVTTKPYYYSVEDSTKPYTKSYN